MKNQTIRRHIHVDKLNYPPLFTFKQEDDAVIKLSLLRNSSPFDITGQTVSLGAKRPDGSLVQMLDGFSINGSELDITLKNSVIAVPGKVEIDLELKDSNGKMTTASFYINVEKKMLGKDNIYASNDIAAINRLETELMGLKNQMEYNVDRFGTSFDKMEEEYKTWRDLAIGENISLSLQNQINDLTKKDYLKIVKTIAERDILENVQTGVICYVEEEGVYYSRKNDEWQIFQSGSGGGGGSVIGTLTSMLDQKTLSVSVGQTLVIDLFFSTPNVGAGTLYVISNGTELLNQSITMGSNKVQLDLTKGTHKLELYVIDRGGVYTNTILVTVHCGGLDISTTFNSEKDYAVGTFITFPYNIDTVSEQPITTYFKIGNNTYEATSNKGYNFYLFPSLGAGSYTVEVYSKSGEFESNKLRFTLVILNSGSLYISSLFDKEEAEEGDQLIIDYRVSMNGVKEFDVEYYVDDSFYKKGKAYNGANTFPISDLKVGNRKITIKVSTTDKQHASEVDINIRIIESSYKMQQPVTSGLMAWFDAYGLSNQDIENNIWKDKSGNGYTGTLHNFNYTTNGWIDNGLKMNGSAYATLNVQPFLNNAETGLTIDIEFKTEDIGNENARVFDCTTRLSSALGCYVDTNEALIKSNANTVKSPFAQNEKTRVTYVIDRLGKITKVYINAVLCEAAFLTDMGSGNDEILEDFKHSEYIYLNSQKGETNFGDCTVYSVRVYGRPLTSEEVLQNHIADIKDKVEQKKKYDFNYNNTIPTMYFYGDTSAMTKENRVDLRIKYISTDEKLYGQSFDLEKCQVQWQGTSSLQYAVKNYKIRLKGEDGKKFKRPLREGMIPEDKFTLKADYMESSHANNTGAAKIVNRYLYETPLPPQEKDSRVVSAIDGFPMKLYVNDELLGVFNFNLDKGNDDSFGFDLDEYPECVSYEVTANTDTTAGAFNKWTSATKLTELEYLQNDFELRFPDEDDYGKDYKYLTSLKRLVDWVSDTTDEQFRNEFDQYFNREYTFKYYLLVLVFGMVDNLGKNMMINTWDGKIWFPCFYDLDTCLALDNSGYVRFDVDIEMTAGTYNTSGSKLWTKVGRVFEKELKDMYKQMRGTIFKKENIFKVLIEEQIDQIPELLYNLDSQQKYLNFGKSYIHMLHGNRREHMKKWITERLLYLDSKLGYEEDTKESITVRANKQGNVYFDIKTYSPMYIKVVWRNGTEQIQKVGRNETKRFSYTLPTATDQEIFIYGAKHLKEIGDISHMTPTSLSLANASRLTKLVCTNNAKLQAIGIGGEANGVSYNLKNLQLLDLTNCSALGTASGNNGLDVSKCDNLKTLKVQGTALQNVTFNAKGGNLEEIYMSNSVTSLYLANQYNLRKVAFYYTSYTDEFRAIYNNCSKIANLTIINCPNLKEFGIDNSLNMYKNPRYVNYRGNNLSGQESTFDISQDDYYRAFAFACLPRLENVHISNALLFHKYININLCMNLYTVKLENMNELKGLIFTGNRSYGGTGGVVDTNIEGIAMFENIIIDKCPNFSDLIMQRIGANANISYKFKENFVFDLSHLPLKRFICNIGLENLKKIILPSTIQEFSHSNTTLNGNAQFASDGSRCKYTKEDSPLETIVIDGHYEPDFVGIDLANIPLKNVNLNGLTMPVNIIKNVNCEAIDMNPTIISQHIFNVDSTSNTLLELDNINISLNNYKGNSLARLFAGADLSKFNVVLDKKLTTEGIDYSYMFSQTKNVKWENINNFISKLPKGKLYRTFERCDVDRLEVGNMIGTSTTDMTRCFEYMDNATSIDLTSADFSNVSNLQYTFRSNSNLESILGIENLINENCSNITGLFMYCYKLKFNFVNGKPNWKFRESGIVSHGGWILECGKNVTLGDKETNMLDLRDVGGFLKGDYYNGYGQERSMGLTHFYIDGYDYTSASNHSGYANYSGCNNLVELHATNITLGDFLGGMVANNPILETVNISGTKLTNNCRGTAFERFFTNNPKLKNVTFFEGMKYGFNISASTLLTVDSLLSIFNGLADLKGSTAQNIKIGEANIAKLSPEQIKIATDKNWTVS